MYAAPLRPSHVVFFYAYKKYSHREIIMKIKLKKSFAANTPADEYDVRQIKKSRTYMEVLPRTRLLMPLSRRLKWRCEFST